MIMGKILLHILNIALAAIVVVESVSPGQARSAGLSSSRQTLLSVQTTGSDCDFEQPCSWRWKNNTTPPGFNVVSGKQIHKTLFDLPPGNFTGPVTDAHNRSDGHFLFVLITESHPASQRDVHLISPKFASTGERCRIELHISMGRMFGGNFKIVIETVNRTSWVAAEKPCNDLNTWEKYSVKLGRISQEFQLMVEVSPGRKTPAYFAIDDVRFKDCFSDLTVPPNCTEKQFRCSNTKCIDRSKVCDLNKDCLNGEDEEQECDKIPEFARCSFEDGTCGWQNLNGKELNWTVHSGKTPTNLTGPSYDHTYRNSTGKYMFVDMSKIKQKHLGATALMESIVFDPPPSVHGNMSSFYYNSCQIRFHYHMFGPHSGLLSLFLVHIQPHRRVPENKWYSYGDKGDQWLREVVTLPNITYRYLIQFEARRGYSSKGDLAVDDISLSPECFGIGIPDNETRGYVYGKYNITPAQPTDPHNDFMNETYYKFTTCGQSGRVGPTPEQCAKAYINSTANITVLQESPMAGVQKWIVPRTGYYSIIARGAAGGKGNGGHGLSRGTLVRAIVELRAGEALYILVGQAGSDAACAKGESARKCQPISSTDYIRVVKNLTIGGGGGGGGGTFIFTINKRKQRIPLLIAGGGGGLTYNAHDLDAPQYHYGHGFNITRGNTSGIEHSESGLAAGAGGGWEEPHGTRRNSRGTSLLEGAFGGEPCSGNLIIGSGGFGGGGGGCSAGGGGGGYSGGDSWSEKKAGQGGFSMVREGFAIQASAEQGIQDGHGAVFIIPSLDNGACLCDFRCVALDEYRHYTQCLCPVGWLLGNDSSTCLVPPGKEIKLTGYLIVLGIVCLVTLGFVAVLCVILYTKYLRNKKDLHRRRMLTGPDLQLNRLRVASGGMMTEYNPNYEFGGGTYTIQDLKEIPREQLRLVKALGQGAFGEVYQGFYKTRANDTVEMPVAVKTLPELSSSQAEMDFLMEALIMSKFNHPNIVHFIGVCFENHPRFIILELLAGGDLKTFLRESRPKTMCSGSERPTQLTMKDLLLCCIDVAKGCKYMEDNHFIHRDIASRNCLLTTKGPGRAVKIADFGMARDIYRADYYKKGGKAMLPVKWMPPEAFLDGIFTSKTDVWSFGVLMWEVMSLGYMPYTGRGNQEVMQLVTNGGRLEPPASCPPPVYGIMTQCWHPIPDERPSFNTILERLGYCMQDPDVIRAPLPVFHRPPSTERDATIMRPPAHDASCLLVPRGQGAMSDYLVPVPGHTIEMHNSPSGGSAEHLLSDGAYLGNNSWETSFVRDGGDGEEEELEEEEEDDEDRLDDESPRSSRALVGGAPNSTAPLPPQDLAPAAQSSVSSTDTTSDVSTSRSTAAAAAASSLLSLENGFNSKTDYARTKLPLQGSLSLDPSTLSRQHSPVLPPPIQYANVSPTSNSNSDCADSSPELRRPYSLQTTPQSNRQSPKSKQRSPPLNIRRSPRLSPKSKRRPLGENEISC